MTTLTQYREGSLRELLKISFPLMLSSLSLMSMLFVDRLLLAHHSTAALTASVNADNLCWVFTYFWVICASITEVFVARYHGAGDRARYGEPVWQMIWLSLGTAVFFVPLAIWGGNWLYSDAPMERNYFRWMMLFGPTSVMYGALCGFFVGQGKAIMITYLALFANFVNGFLDIALIFGVKDYIPSLGAEGAAIATCIAYVFQVVVLFALFLKRSNRLQYGTGDSAFKWDSFWRCFRVGAPGASYVAIEWAGWAAFFYMMTQVGEKHITATAICQTVVACFYFVSEGVCKGAATLAGNYIGSNRTDLVRKVVTAGSRLHLIVFAVSVVLYGLFADVVIDRLLPAGGDMNPEAIRQSLKTCLLFMLVYLLFEGLRCVLYGVLTAAGDTFYLMVAGTLSMWAFLILPMYVMIHRGNATVEMATLICALYCLATALIHLWRFLRGHWRGSVARIQIAAPAENVVMTLRQEQKAA